VAGQAPATEVSATKTRWVDRHEPLISLREAMIGAGLLLAFVFIAGFSYIVRDQHDQSQVRPAACSQLGQPVNQLAADLNQAVTASKSGLVPTDALTTDNTKLLALAQANPGSFENHVKPIDDAVTKLLTDMQGVTSAQNEPQVFVTIASTADDALVWCHLAKR